MNTPASAVDPAIVAALSAARRLFADARDEVALVRPVLTDAVAQTQWQSSAAAGFRATADELAEAIGHLDRLIDAADADTRALQTQCLVGAP